MNEYPVMEEKFRIEFGKLFQHLLWTENERYVQVCLGFGEERNYQASLRWLFKGLGHKDANEVRCLIRQITPNGPGGWFVTAKGTYIRANRIRNGLICRIYKV